MSGRFYPDLSLAEETEESNNESSDSESTSDAETGELGQRVPPNFPNAEATSAPMFGKFRGIKELNLNFAKVAGKDKKHPYTYCVACNETIKSTDTAFIEDHLKMCALDDVTKKKIQDAIDKEAGTELRRMCSVKSDKLDLEWTQVAIKNNLSLRLVEAPDLRSFMKKLKPEWHMPSRKIMSNKYIPRLARAVDEAFKNRLDTTNENFLISAEFDHWRDATDRSVLAIVATLPEGTRHLMTLEDVTLRGHSTNSILKSLLKSLNTIDTFKLNAIMSDSAASCKKARAELILNEGFTHVIEYRCQAHLFNLIGARMMNDKDVDEMFIGANKLVSFISGHERLQALLSEEGYNKLVKATAIRWYSHVAMFESLLSIQDEAKRLLRSASRDARRHNVEEPVAGCSAGSAAPESQSDAAASRAIRKKNQCLSICASSTAKPFGKTYQNFSRF